MPSSDLVFLYSYKDIPFESSLVLLAYHAPMSQSRFPVVSPFQQAHQVDSVVDCFALLLCSTCPIKRHESKVPYMYNE